MRTVKNVLGKSIQLIFFSNFSGVPEGVRNINLQKFKGNRGVYNL